MPEDSTPTGRKEVVHMGRLEEIASTFARVEELAQQILHFSQQRHANKLSCEEYRHVVEEIAWKFFDAVRQY